METTTTTIALTDEDRQKAEFIRWKLRKRSMTAVISAALDSCARSMSWETTNRGEE